MVGKIVKYLSHMRYITLQEKRDACSVVTSNLTNHFMRYDSIPYMRDHTQVLSKVLYWNFRFNAKQSMRPLSIWWSPCPHVAMYPCMCPHIGTHNKLYTHVAPHKQQIDPYTLPYMCSGVDVTIMHFAFIFLHQDYHGSHIESLKPTYSYCCHIDLCLKQIWVGNPT